MENTFIRIFVEGDEKVFIDNYLSHLFEKKIKKYDIICTGGWTNLHLEKNKFRENTDDEGINLVIFDADTNFDKRKNELEKQKTELGIEFELFLLPNNQDTGDFEALLERISNETHKCIFECFDKYQECLSNKNEEYVLPNRKARIFAYLETLNEDTKPKKRNYSINRCWNLTSSELDKLKDFLLKYYH